MSKNKKVANKDSVMQNFPIGQSSENNGVITSGPPFIDTSNSRPTSIDPMAGVITSGPTFISSCPPFKDGSEIVTSMEADTHLFPIESGNSEVKKITADRSTWPKYWSRIDVDNHLGTLYNNVRAYYKNMYIPRKATTYKVAHFDHLEYEENVVDLDLAKRVRDYLNLIRFDPSIKLLNDTDNQPKFDVYNASTYLPFINSALDEKVPLDAMWSYEKYKEFDDGTNIFRLRPNTLVSFVHSPIFELISAIEAKFPNHMIQTATLQLITNSMGYHTDKANLVRDLTYLYYITPDNWSYSDGGCLAVTKNKLIDFNDTKSPDICYENRKLLLDSTYIKPKFNSGVKWNLNKADYLHGATRVRVDPREKKRFCFVFIFQEKAKLQIE